MAALQSSGVAVAVASDDKPDSSWPFQRMGEYWVVRHELAGPKGAISEGAYLPTQTWRPTASAQFRRQIVLAGVLVSLMTLGTLLIRPARGQIIAMLAIVIVSCVLIDFWRRRQLATYHISGEVIVSSAELLQSDHWEYLAARSETTPTFEVSSPPMLYGVEQAERTGLRMKCGDNFAITWTMSLPANSRMALLDRRVMRQAAPKNFPPAGRSPLGDMARQLYLRPGLEIRGEQTSPQFEWGTLVIGDE
jgi:hypothetical protein